MKMNVHGGLTHLYAAVILVSGSPGTTWLTAEQLWLWEFICLHDCFQNEKCTTHLHTAVTVHAVTLQLKMRIELTLQLNIRIAVKRETFFSNDSDHQADLNITQR